MIYPRDAAMRVLTRVLSDRVPLDEAIEGVAGEMPADQRAWLVEVCSGTLRWKGRLDWIIDQTALKKKPSGWLRKALLLGAYQLVAQDRTQPGAAVSETVEAIKRKEGVAPSRFANACLRKIADHAADWRALPLEPSAPLKQAAAWASLPEWLWKRISEERGFEWARAFAQASLERPELWIRTREGGRQLPPSGAVSGLKGFAEGEFFVQDISSQKLVSEVSALCRERSDGRKLRALDLCAAPGGKALGLAWEGFDVEASDRDESRLRLLRQNVARLKSEVKVIAPGEASGSYDLVWVDAPCTGSGIVRRHPDVRWIRHEKDIASLARLQADLLKNAMSKVAPGGFLMYSVCSVLEEEGPKLAAALLPARSFEKSREWLLAPQDAPHGDGFWGGFFRRLQ